MADGYMKIGNRATGGPGICHTATCGNATPAYHHVAILRDRHTSLGVPRDPYELCIDCSQSVTGHNSDMPRAVDVLLEVAANGHPVTKQALRRALLEALPRLLAAVSDPVSAAVSQAIPDLDEDTAPRLLAAVTQALLDAVLPPVEPGVYGADGRPYVPPPAPEPEPDHYLVSRIPIRPGR